MASGPRTRRAGAGWLGRCLAAFALASSLATLCGCSQTASPVRPSILLVVIDTLRADAVSAYGAQDGTTPTLDALAADGRLYTRAYSPSPWTLPSHASLFSGAAIDEHGVGLHGRVVLPAGVRTLAERLQAVDYETAAFSENALVSPLFGFEQGFDHFAVRGAEEQFAANRSLVIDGREEVAGGLERRDPSRPFFVFLNLYDPHEPYVVRRDNPFLPTGATTAQGKRAGAGGRTSHRICERLPGPAEVALLRGLYLGDVAAADRKLATVLELLRAAAPSRLLTVVTSDHGEHFGEHRLLDHEFSVREAVLHVPLVVHGAGLAPERVEQPVELRDVTRSVLDWAGADTAGIEAAGLPSGAAAESTPPASLLAVYSDTRMRLPADFDATVSEQKREAKRETCGAEDRVFGDMVAVTRFPFKLNWYERYPSELFDLREDPGEQVPRGAERREVFAALEEQAREFVERTGLGGGRVVEPLSSDAEEALRNLGYLD